MNSHFVTGLIKEEKCCKTLKDLFPSAFTTKWIGYLIEEINNTEKRCTKKEK